MIDWPPIPPPAGGDALAADLVHLQIALPLATDVWDGATWDAATWDAVDFANVVDASCDTPGVTIDRGRSDPLGHVAPARISFQLDNPAGLWSPWTTVDAAGHDLGGPVFGPDVPFRVATHLGPLAVGFIATVTETDDDGESTVAVTATDALAYLADANGLEQGSQGTHETAGPRLARIFAAAQLTPLVDVDLDPGTAPLQATTLARAALEESWLTADSDGGSLWATAAGIIRYVDAPGLEAPEFTEPVARFTDAANEQPGVTLCPISFTATRSRANVKNVASVARAGGTAYVARDAASIARHGQRSTQRHDLIHEEDSWSRVIAERMIARLAGGDLQISPIDGVPTDDDHWFELAHALDLGHRVRLDRTRFGQQLAVLATVDAITHSITLDQWTMTIRCSPGVQTSGYTHWDSGQWDVSPWDRQL